MSISLLSTLIDINANSQFLATIFINPQPAFKDAILVRHFEYNMDLLMLKEKDIGSQIALNFFKDKSYTAVIKDLMILPENRTVISAEVNEQLFSYCYIVVSETEITISAEIPFKNEYYFASIYKDQAFLGLMKYEDIKKDIYQSSGPLIPPVQSEWYNGPGNDSRNDVVIDLLIVYTPAAENWALQSILFTNIDHVIDVAIARANLVMINSQTAIIFNVVHRHLTNYVEEDTSDDFLRITSTNDGYMDEVHVLRDQYFADVMVFLAHISYTGGSAWLLDSFSGFSHDRYAISINRVQQSGTGYTVVHEIGHNMGADHHYEQNVQPGPNYDLAMYTSGWRGIVSGQRVCSVMTYEDGIYFDDGLTHIRIPYFSSPLIVLEGTMIGSPFLMDNARILRETKNVTAGYRTSNVGLAVSPPQFDFGPVENFDNQEKIFIITNSSNETRMIQSISIQGPNHQSFSISCNGFVPWTLMQDESFEFSVLFSPLHNNHYSASVNIVHDSNPTPIKVYLTGDSYSIYSAPFFEDFNEAENLIHIGWNGALNTFSGLIPYSGIGLSKALVLELHTISQSVNTPRITSITDDSFLKFSYRIIDHHYDWSEFLPAKILTPGDVVLVEVSTNGEAGPYTIIHTIDHTNHIASNSFLETNIPLSFFENETINIRFMVTPASLVWYFVLDNVGVTGPISEKEEIPTPITRLIGNHPNPFNPQTNIDFSLETAGKVSIEIYNIKGQKVRCVTNENWNRGKHSVVWNGKDDNGFEVSSGIYFYQLKMGEYNSIKKMLLIK